MADPDPFDLQRFVDAQAANYAEALTELRAGRKVSHWMWYVFPQLQGLGSSAMARRYALCSLDEAQAYLAHPILGARLLDCTRAMLAHAGRRTAREILSTPDDLKLRSSMTLFARAAPGLPEFQALLDGYFGGKPDAGTLQLLGARA